MGLGGGGVLKDAHFVQAALFVQRRETHFDQKYSIQSPNLLHVFVCYPKKSESKVRVDSNKLPMGQSKACKKKAHQVKWPLLCMDKKSGGLEIRNFSILNQALPSKS